MEFRGCARVVALSLLFAVAVGADNAIARQFAQVVRKRASTVSPSGDTQKQIVVERVIVNASVVTAE